MADGGVDHQRHAVQVRHVEHRAETDGERNGAEQEIGLNRPQRVRVRSRDVQHVGVEEVQV